MKFFLDTADTGELREAAASGLVDGITTNPTLIAKTGRPLAAVVEDLVSIVDGPISVETISLDAAGMVDEGRRFAAIHKNIVVKCPLTREGLKATKLLTSEGHKVNVTLCFSAMQALLAAKAGATYISPFVGRLDDIGQDGMILIRDICEIYRNYGFATQVLAASLRHPVHVLASAKAGAHVGTLPYKVFQQLFNHPLTDSGLAQFLSDWKKVPTA
ncbi:transaldolase [Hydrocarboniphaga daqingensis]|jgi:transaldolase|uniref:Probable transaldolase n=1 Tax=Hydrocarboniphaga daqingensis TaxID=490188 RepID=A0A1M5QRJ4_9GAMM|nr:fructose-6-phosphate aldolase [Hydrocarboniphaga daqingensis]SHH16203.1 transaldolase [Hydrocarboniphaga daqingensis]